MNTIDASAQMLRTIIENGIKSDDELWTENDHVLYFASPSTSAIRAVNAEGLLNYPPFQKYFNEDILNTHLKNSGLKAVLWLSSHHEILGCIDKSNKCGAFTSFNWKDESNYRSIDRNDITFVGKFPDEPTLRKSFELLLDCRKLSTS